MYHCADCGLAVIVADGEVIRACQCNGTIIAEMKVDIEAGAEVKV